ncbi:RHS repeat-associated core domain-containing protein [Amycolatopsis marina]|uniref:RHS repeat-associated core domain-containing protein n=1 Tax=Amycolatopsis marina TaxID=490629 RepID=A0A1I1BJ34_9PSEU|nr:DNRLRE domain-containing protein [Amycolatopsis marina]SFB50385.1 RHS repeat-associated core domain-containing protein [Amycolatopsis marina]
MRSSRKRGFLSRALITALFVALLTVGMPVGPPVTSAGGTDLGLGRLWNSVVGLISPESAAAEPAPRAASAPEQPPEPPKRVKELVDKRSATTKVFAMSDGRTEVEISPEPRHFRDGDGWSDIDPTVIERARDGYRFGNDKNRFRSDFGDKSDRLVRFEAAGKQVALGIAGESRALSPRVQGDTVTYPDAFGNADLEYEVTGEALKERIVLPSPVGESVFRFTMRLGGVTARQQPDGSIGFFAKGAAGEHGPPLFVMPRPFMFDSSADQKSPHGKVFSDKVTQTVEQQGANITVTVAADKDWLAAPERRYPVVIDPTIKIEPTPTTGEDVQIWSDTPTRNDGSSYRLSVGTDPWGVARSLLKFDTSVVPAGTSLTSARLRTYYDSELHTAVNNVEIEARRITQAWSEDTATWNSANQDFAEAGLSTAVKQANKANVWHEFDVRNIAQSWVSGSAQNHGLMLKATDEALNRGGAIYQAAEFAYGGEVANRPKLVLTYGRPSVNLHYPTTIRSTGAELNWDPYVDPQPTNPADDVVEYQVHRTVYQAFTPSRYTLIAPLSPDATSFSDTTARPTPADSPDPFGAAYYYMIVAKTRDGQLIPGPTQVARLPKAGRVTQILQTSEATTLSSGQPDTNLDTFGGQKWLSAGIGSSTYATTRPVVNFPDLSSIPANARIEEAEVGLWGFYSWGSGARINVHQLDEPFVESEATWRRASAATAWTAGGGTYGTMADQLTTVTNDPKWNWWDVSGLVQSWVNDPASNHGMLVRLNDTAVEQRALFLSDEAAEPQLRPNLVVTYTEPTAESTYYAPDTPSMRMIPGDEYTVPVTLTNTTGATWSSGNRVLSYRWGLPDGTDVTTGGNRLETALPADVPPMGTVTVQARVKTPIQSAAGNKREQFVLSWDLRDTTDGSWLSGTGGIPALPQNVTVEDPTSDELGLEKFYSYVGKSTGAGSNVLVNQYAGNTVFSYDALSNPGRGLSTFLRMTYNSMDTSATSMGYGWSLAASGVTRLGTSLDLHPRGQDYPSLVTMPDGDGTSHEFTLNKHDSTDPAVWTYDKPAGVHLHLARVSGEDTSRRWMMTRPDRTKFFFDDEGWLSAVADRNGNTQNFTYTERKSNNQPRKFLAYVTDPAGRQSLTLDYWEKGETRNPKLLDMVQSVTDVSGRKVTFGYDDKGLLTEMVDGAGTPLAKTFRFAYDAEQGNKNVKLVAVTDPRGNTSDLAYYTAPEDPKDKWKAKTLTDRLGHDTGFAYADPDGSAGSEMTSTVTDAEGHNSSYRMDGYGRPTSTTNAKNETTAMTWDADNNVVSLTEDNGAVSTWTYDPKTGYPTSIRDAEAVANNTPPTTLEYRTALGGYTAELTGKVSPEGRRWAFGYDGNGNLTTVTDPKGVATPDVADDYRSVYTYDPHGQLLTSTDANGNTTTFADYHAAGYPRATTDALANTSTVGYDVRGNVVTATDAAGATTTAAYDVFGRPLETTVPKDADAGELITTPAPVYDANDNVTQSTAPNGATTTATYDPADQLTAATEPKDTPDGPERRSTFSYDTIGNLLAETQPLGTLTPADPDDFVTRYAYDEISQLTAATNAAGETISYTYDNVGNLVTVVDPRKNATTDAADYTTKIAYDRNHRQVSTTDALGHVTSQTYDLDGNVTTSTDAEKVTTTYVYDERSSVVEVRAPHATVDGKTVVRTTRVEYDQVGNQTRVITPRGVDTADDPDDFAARTVYDKLNRPIEKHSPHDPGDARYGTPDITRYAYDKVGNLAEVSAPPSAGQSVRNSTSYSYFDNGWIRGSTDPWDIATTYDYNNLGQQTARTFTSAGGSSARTMSWDYYPDGKLKSRSDDGVPVGKHVVLVDNSDTPNLKVAGNWATSSEGAGFQGYDYRTAPAGTGDASVTWTLNVPQDGDYEVFARYPGAQATNAPYTVRHSGGETTTAVNQTQQAGEWVSLGTHAFTKGNSHNVELTDKADGQVAADSVKLVRDNSGDTDTEAKTFSYTYDANANLTSLTDSSPGANVDAYAMGYNGLNQLAKVEEKLAGAVQNTTAFSYDPNGNPLSRDHDTQDAAFEYDPRDLVAKVTNTETGQDPKVTTYGYTARGQVDLETKANGNTVDYGYHLDGQLASQVETKGDGTLVAQHFLGYNANGHRIRDASKVQNADDHSAYLDEVREYGYDPQDRIASVTKKAAGTGAVLETETYAHDANSNVIDQTVDGTTTTFNYDRNRLLSATSAGTTAAYNYDPYGRLNTVTAAGQVIERLTYDGFDRTIEHEKINDTGGLDATTYDYDPLDRTTTKTADGETTEFAYLGLTDKVVTEEIGGQVQRSYAYSAWGARLSQVKHDTDGTGPEVTEDSFYGYNPHTDVETLTSETGDTRATYGYTAYGKDDEEAFTGIDKPDAQNPSEEPYNFYRFNGKRWDPSSGSYDMGFRDYNPGLNRFLTRDSYNGALADLGLGTDPWTGNRYAFTGGNPISRIEIDGHLPMPIVQAKPDIEGTKQRVAQVQAADKIDQPALGRDLTQEEQRSLRPLGYEGAGKLSKLDAVALAGQSQMAWQKVCTLINQSRDGCYAGTTSHPTFDDAKPFVKLLYELSPFADVADCVEGSAEGCAWLASNMIPFSKVAKGVGKVGGAVGAAGEVADMARRVDVENLKMTNSVANHLGDYLKDGRMARPYMNSPLTIREIVSGGSPVIDPGGAPNSIRWDVPGSFRGSAGNWELVVNTQSNTILHFNFTTGGS